MTLPPVIHTPVYSLPEMSQDWPVRPIVYGRSDGLSLLIGCYERLRFPCWLLVLSLRSFALGEAGCHVMRLMCQGNKASCQRTRERAIVKAGPSAAGKPLENSNLTRDPESEPPSLAAPAFQMLRIYMK